MGYRRSTPRNVILGETKIPPLQSRFIYLGCNFLSRCRAHEGHPLITVLSKIHEIRSNPTFVPRNGESCLVECYNITESTGHLLATSCKPFVFNTDYDILSMKLEISTFEGYKIAKSNNPNTCFKATFECSSSESWYFTDGSKQSNHPFAGFAVFSQSTQKVMQGRTSNIASIFTCELLALILALNLATTESNDNIVIFSDSLSVLLALNDSSVSSNKSYLILELKKRVFILNNNLRKVKFYWIP